MLKVRPLRDKHMDTNNKAGKGTRMNTPAMYMSTQTRSLVRTHDTSLKFKFQNAARWSLIFVF